MLIGCSNNPHIDLEAFRSSHFLDFMFLEKPQKLGLHWKVDVGQFIEKDRSSVRFFEQALSLH